MSWCGEMKTQKIKATVSFYGGSVSGETYFWMSDRQIIKDFLKALPFDIDSSFVEQCSVERFS